MRPSVALLVGLAALLIAVSCTKREAITKKEAGRDSVCEALIKRVAAAEAKHQRLANADIAGLISCALEVSNKNDCEGKPEPCGRVGVVAGNPQNPAAPSTPVVIDTSNSADIKKACGIIATSVAAANGADSTLLILAGPVGAKTCDSYLKAAARRDPLLIFAPAMIPAVQLAQDVRDAAISEANRVVREAGSDPLKAALIPGAVVGVAQYNIVAQGFKSVTGIDLPPAPEIKVEIPGGGGGSVGDQINHILGR